MQPTLFGVQSASFILGIRSNSAISAVALSPGPNHQIHSDMLLTRCFVEYDIHSIHC
jgi:hypothetical protein